jgi:tetratricopeptide (TPR) repeat protein
LDLAQKCGHKKEETKAYIGLGRAYKLNNEFQMAIQYFQKALKIAKERGDKENETDAHLG